MANFLEWRWPGREERKGSGARSALGYGLCALVTLLALTACDLDVQNPGPIQDEFLENEGAFPSIVQGFQRHNAIALGWVAYTGVYPTDEAVSSGISTAPLPEGVITPEQGSSYWNWAHQGRWMAEDAVERFRGALGDGFSNSEMAATALLFAGYGNRLLGENFCYHVVSGGEAGPSSVHLETAESYFTEAAQVAQGAGSGELRMAAIAGRASPRAFLGNWQGAVEDAAQVPDDFRYQFRYLASLDWADYNRLYFRIANEPWRRYTVWSTFYETYYEETGDPRTPWTVNPDFPIGNDGRDTPFYIQQKFTRLDSPINVSSGREMRLLEAEHLLRQQDWTAAMDIINGLRTSLASDHTGAPLEPWEANSLEQAWTALKRERGIELWLEGRRLPDLQRWLEEGTPGDQPDMTGRSL